MYFEIQRGKFKMSFVFVRIDLVENFQLALIVITRNAVLNLNLLIEVLLILLEIFFVRVK